jgi:hypothetical protein
MRGLDPCVWRAAILALTVSPEEADRIFGAGGDETGVAERGSALAVGGPGGKTRFHRGSHSLPANLHDELRDNRGDRI